jgi:inosine/xanthosine triphosphate pyrophosphatase family protein
MMFSVETEFDYTIITILDNKNKYEDVQYILSDDKVYIRQFNEEHDAFEVIEMSAAMFNEMGLAMKKTDGVYLTEYVNK